MKKLISIVMLGAVSCSVPLTGETPDEVAPVSIDTRSVLSRNVQVLAFYPDGKLAAYSSAEAAGTQLRLRAGVPYSLMVLADCPDVSGTPYSTRTAVDGVQVPLNGLMGEIPSQAVMSLPLFGDEGLSVSPALTRQLARVRLVSVTNEMPSSMGALELESVYLSNVVANRSIGGEGSGWLNPMGRLSPAPGPTYAGIGSTLASGRTLTMDRDLYCYPNPTSADTCGYDVQMTPRFTRLVLAARIGGQLRYYPISLRGIEENTTYDISLTINNLGSNDPDLPVATDAMKAVVTMSEWAFGENININF